MKKKVLSLVLCIAMLFSLVAAAIPAGAVDIDPRGQVYGEDLEAKPGDTIYMNYYLYNPVEEGIGGVSFRNAYDTSVMSIVEIEDKLDEQYGSTLTKAASYGKLTAWITKLSVYGDCLLGTAEIKIAEDAKPGVYEFTFDHILLTTDWFEEIEPNDAINYITIVGDKTECDEHVYEEGSGVVTPPSRTEEGKVELTCTKCGAVQTIELPAVEIGFSVPDVKVNADETVTVSVLVNAPATGLYGATLYVYADEAIDLSDAVVAVNGEAWEGGADEVVALAPKAFDEQAAALCEKYGIDFDGTGKTIIPITVEPANAVDNIYGEGVTLVTVTFPAPAAGEYDIGAIVHGDLFAGYNPEWYAGVESVIDYDVTGAERLAEATLTVHEHTLDETSGKVTEPTRESAGKVEIYCTACGELLDTIELPAVEIGFGVDDVKVNAGETEVTFDVNVKAPATGLYGATLYIILDERLDASTATVTAGDLWKDGADITVLDPRTVDEKVLANCEGIDADLTGKTIIPVIAEPNDANAVENLYGEGALVTVTLATPEVGEYAIGAVVYGDLFGGYNPDWYAGVADVINYEVSAAERLAEATLTVHEHTLSGDVTPPTRTEEGKVELYCTECGELVETIVLPAVEIGFSVPDVQAKSGEEVTVSVLVKAPATGLYGATLYLYLDENIDVTGVKVVANNEAWAGGADELGNVTPREFDDVAAEICSQYGIDFDGTGKTIIPVTLEPANAVDNIYGDEVVLVTVTFKAPTKTGTYDIGAIVHGALFAGYAEEWYAGVEDVINYDVTGEERLASGTLTVNCDHDGGTHEENRVEATCTEDGHYDLVCDICGEVVEANVEIPATGHGTTHEENRVEATCTEDGHYDLVCDICGEVVEANVEIPATGHGTTHEENREEAKCEDEGSYDLVCDICGEVVEHVVIPMTGHTPGAWEIDPEDPNRQIQKCTVCGKVLDERYNTLTGIDLEAGWSTEQAVLVYNPDEELGIEGTITVIAKKGAPEADFRVAFPASDVISRVYVVDGNVTIRQINNGVVETVGAGVQERSTQWKYFVSYAADGVEQHYTIKIVDAEGVEHVYAVTVKFVQSAPCSGVEPGFYAATAELLEGNVINIVSKAGAPEVDFRLENMASGSVPSLKEGGAHVIQWVESDGDYVDVTAAPEKETNTQWKYFRSLKAEGAEQHYIITVSLIDGSTVDYTVNVTFVD